MIAQRRLMNARVHGDREQMTQTVTIMHQCKHSPLTQIASQTRVQHQLVSAPVSTDAQPAQQEEIAQPRRARGKWSVSPLREAKILLGVLKQQGLVGKGLIEAFEKWAPKIVGSSRANMNEMYRKQTGQEMSDYILVQQADKVVRYNQFSNEVQRFRQAFVHSGMLGHPEQCGGNQIAPSAARVEEKSGFSARGKAPLMCKAEQVETPNMSGMDAGRIDARRLNRNAIANPRTKFQRHMPDLHNSNALLSTTELAELTGFKPKTIRRWVSRKLLNYIRVGNQFRFRRAAVDLFLTQREVRRQ